MSVTLTRTSSEFVYGPIVRAFRDGDEADPTTLPVEVALLEVGTLPVEADWTASDWAPNATTPTVRTLIGPGGIALDPGDYTLFVRVTGAVERPEHAIGRVRII